jgi:two-component system chemotaxis response regulator CheB
MTDYDKLTLEIWTNGAERPDDALRFCPSANRLFSSVAEVFGEASLAIIMTGMGEDGVEGLRTLKQRGGRVVAQDRATSVVYGMPGAAVEAGVVDQSLPLDQIAGAILSWALPTKWK